MGPGGIGCPGRGLSGFIEEQEVIGGETLGSLASKIRNGNGSIDVHTAANPGEAIRGHVAILQE